MKFDTRSLGRASLVVLALCAANSLAQQSAPGKLQIANLGRCVLDSGQTIDPCILGYRTYGRLNAEMSNAIVFPTWYGGTSEELANFFGPDKLVDTSRFFGVAIDAFGDGISSSPSNSASRPGPAFPAVTIRDMVHAEYRLVTEVLRLRHLHAVIGISMGGMQTFEWMVDYPQFLDRAVSIVGTPWLTAQDLLHFDLVRKLIVSDPGFNGGNYAAEPSLELFNEFDTLTLHTPAYIARTVPREGFPRLLESSLKPKGVRDANDRLFQLEAMKNLDVTRGLGSLADAARRVHIKQLIVVSTQDQLANPAPALEWAQAIQAQTFVSTGDCGHSIMECDGSAIISAVHGFLEAKQPPSSPDNSRQ